MNPFYTFCKQLSLNFGLRVLIILCLITVSNINSFAQVTVTNPGNVSPALSGVYLTLADAITDLNATTSISGQVIITLSGNEMAPLGGYAITAIPAGASSTNNIIIQGSTSIITAYAPQTSGSLNDAIFKLIGADFITIRNFSMMENPLNFNAAAGTNDMTEWGIAFLYASTTNGAQNNTIQNNTISLNRTYLNTFGIYSNTRHTSTLVTTAAEATSSNGTNSFNKIYSNSISNVNYGLVLIGSGATSSVIDAGNDIGGNSLVTGNTFSNWGGGSALSGYISLTGSNYCVFLNQQINDNFSFNTITSASGLTISTATFGGFLKNFTAGQPSGTITSTINNNTVTLTNSPTTGAMIGINSQGLTALASATMSLNNNTILNCVISGAATSASFTGVTNLSAPGTLNMTGNVIRGTTSSATTGGFVGISNSGAVVNTINITNNQIGNASGNAITFAGATTGICNGIQNSGGASTCNLNINGNSVLGFSFVSAGSVSAILNTSGFVGANISMNSNLLGSVSGNFITYSGTNTAALNGVINQGGSASSIITVSNNDIRGITHAVPGSSAHTYVGSTFVAANVTIANNTFTNLNVNTTGTTIFINHGYSIPVTGQMVINNNSIVTAYNRGGASGSVTLTTTNSLSGTGSINNYTNNNFSNITINGTSTITGFNNTDGGTGSTKAITGNIFNNWIGGTGTINAMNFTYWNGSSSLSNNTITNITGQAAITGVTIGTASSAATLITVANNTITGLSSTGTGGNVTGITCSNASTVININGNTINTLSSSGVSSTVLGINIGGATTTSVFQNIINNLSGTGTTSPLVRGVSVTGGTTVNVYRNKIYDLYQSAAISTTNGAVNGLIISGGTTVNFYNNLIGDLRAPQASLTDAIRGINITSSSLNSSYNIYNNTIFINASSSGANFGNTGIFHTSNATATTAVLDLRNNIVVNTSTPAGTGVVTVLRRSSNVLSNFGNNSNRNMYYAGVPSAVNTIMTDGASFYQDYASYFGAVGATRESASVVDAGYSGGGFFASVIGSNANYLQPSSGFTTQVESGASVIGIVSNDYNGITRPNPPGTSPDMGAWEFNGITPAPSISGVTVPANTCNAGLVTTINATITTPSPTTLTSVMLNYNNGGAGSIAMVNNTGNNWTADIPVGTVGGTVTWSIVATNSIPLVTTVNGSSYIYLPPITNFTTSANASLNPICSGSPTVLNLGLTGTVNASAPSYSAPIPVTNPTTDEDIGNVTISQGSTIILNNTTPINSLVGTIGTATGTAGSYSNFTAFGPYNLIAASTYTISISSLQQATAFGNAFGVYIDYNRNGVFTDAGETVYLSPATISGAHTRTANFTVPANVALGYTRMRVINNEGLVTSPTMTVAYGEFEEYMINLQPAPTSVTWYTGATPVGFTNPLTVNPISTTTYRGEFNLLGCPINQTSTPAAPTVTVNVMTTPGLPVAVNDTRCGVGIVNLGASSSGGTLNWFSSATAGPSINTGTTYSPNISTTTSYYVRETPAGASTANVGLLTTSPGTTAYASSSGNYQTFDVLSTSGIMINTLDIYPNAATPVGTPIVIQLENSSGQVLGSVSTTTNTAGGTQTITMNMFVPQGTAYRLRPSQNPNMLFHQTGVSHPYTIPNVVSITGYDGGPALYAFFYNWNVTYGCFSAVATVTGTVTPAPVLTVTPNGPTTYCGTGSVGITASGPGYVNFSWTPSTGLSSTTTGAVTANPTSTTTYTVVANDGLGCAAQQNITVTVNPLPSVQVLTNAPSTVCLNDPFVLNTIGGSETVKQFGSTENPGATTVSIYNGGNATSRSQLLYTAAELNAGGLVGPGFITSIAFQVSNKLSVGSYQNFTIDIATTASTSVTTTYQTTGFSNRFTGSVITTLGWNKHVLTTPYFWDGVSNLVIQTCFSNAAAIGFDQVFTSPTTVNRFIQSNLLGCTAATGVATLNRPNVRFTGGLISYSWSPGTDLSATNVPNPTVTPTTGGPKSYTITVTDGGTGCQNSAVINFNVTNAPPAPLVAVTSNTAFCQSGVASFTSSGTTGSLQWQSSPTGAPNSWTNIPSATGTTYTSGTLTNDTYFRLEASCGGSNQSNEILITIQKPLIATTSPGSRCGVGTVNLSATGNGNAINWYANASGGLPLTTGNNFTTPVISATTNYWASTIYGSAPFNVSKVTYEPASTGTNLTTYGQDFTVTTAFNLLDVKVFSTTGTAITISLYSANGAAQLFTTGSVPVVAGSSPRINLGWAIAPGTYRLVANGMTGNFYRDNTNVTYPFALPGIGTMNGFVSAITGTVTTSSSYYFMYDWTVSTGCESPRVMVPATVTTAPVLNVFGTSTICQGTQVNLSVTSPNDPAYTYVWTPGNLSGSAHIVNPNASTVYTVSAIDNTAGPNAGCTAIGSATVTVNATPVVSTSAVSNPLCQGSSTVLNSLVSNVDTVKQTIGTGTLVNSGTTFPAPYGQFYEASRHQILIRASELTTAGFTAGALSSVALNVTATNGAGVHKDFNIKMAHTAVTALTTTFQTGTFTQVLNPINYIPALGLNVHNFNNNFVWNGTSNIIVEFCFNSDLGASVDYTNNASTTYSTTAFNSVTYYNLDDSPTVCSSTTGTTSANRPNLRFTQTKSVSYAWTPAGSLNNAAIANPTATPGTSTNYILNVTSDVGCVGTSSILVNVNPMPSAVISPSGSTILCGGQQVTLSAGAGQNWTYLWSTFETTQSIDVDAAGSYTVTITAPGCPPVVSNPVDVIVNYYSFMPSVLPSVINTPCPQAGYNLIASGPADSSWTWLGPNGYTAFTQNVSVNQTGTYTVTVDSAGCSSFPVSIILNTNQCQACATPTGVAHSNVGAGKADVSWSPAFTGDSFLIRYWDISTGIYQFKNIPSGQSSTTLDYLDWQNATYVWQVKTICASPQPYSKYSVTDTFTTVAGTSMPCNYRPILPTTLGVTATTADLIWYPVNADAFIVRYEVAGSGIYRYQAVSGGIGNPSATQLVGLLPSTDYNWWVLGICNGVKSRYSVMGNFQTDAGSIPCIKPFDTRGINLGTTTATVEWNGVVTADEFRVKYAINTLPYVWKYKTVSGIPNVNSIALTGLTPNRTYRFQVQTICSGIKSDYSFIELFTTLANPSGQSRNITEDARGTLSLSAYPNPARENVTVSFGADSEGGKYLVRLLDLSGRMLMERNGTAPKGQYQEELKLEGLAAGMYLLEVRIGEKQGFLRLTLE